VAEEAVGEELGGAELAAGWGNDQSGLPLARCSRRKMTAGKSRGLASLARGRRRRRGAGTRHSFWPGRTAQGGSSAMGNGCEEAASTE
jgi:hypothetical protein